MCFVRVLWVLCWIVVLRPLVPVVPQVFGIACVLRVFCESRMPMLMRVLMLMLMRSEVGGSESGVSPPPNREIDFGFGCDCVACVRASERSCVREMIPVWLGLAARICGTRRRRAGEDPKYEFEQCEL